MIRSFGYLLTMLVPLTTLAQEAASPATPGAEASGAASSVHRHLGFFVRPELGVGVLATASNSGMGQLGASGGGVYSIAIGAAVSEDFIVAGQAWDHGASILGASADSVGLVGLGVLLNWYFMPNNSYLAVTPSWTRIGSIGDGFFASTNWGFGLRGALGWEWWVGDRWGLGLAASMAFSSNEIHGTVAESWGTVCFGLSLSATYN